MVPISHQEKREKRYATPLMSRNMPMSIFSILCYTLFVLGTSAQYVDETVYFDGRNLLNRVRFDRNRKLGGPKSSPTPSPPSPSPSPPPAVNCAGTWNSWGTCTGGSQSRTYSVTTSASNGGSACPSPETKSCTNCEGSWSSWSSCGDGNVKTRSYTVSQAASSSGTQCPSSPESQSCLNCNGSWSDWTVCSANTQSRSLNVEVEATNGGSPCPSSPQSRSCSLPVRVINWDYMVPAGKKWFNVSEMPLVHCEIGQTVRIEWNRSSIQHDIFEMYSYASFVDCRFVEPSVQRALSSTSGSYEFTCDTMGTRFFACGVNQACKGGKQRVRVHTIDSRKTSAITKKGATLAEYMREAVRLYEVDYHGAIAEPDAVKLEDMLLSIATNSPASCADWLVPSDLSNTTCLAYVYVDLGVLYRKRASFNAEISERYYHKSLSLIPNFCLSESYLVELQIKLNNQTAADAQYQDACKACGALDLDIELIRMAYAQKGWELPANDCTNPPAAKDTRLVQGNVRGYSGSNSTFLSGSARNRGYGQALTVATQFTLLLSTFIFV